MIPERADIMDDSPLTYNKVMVALDGSELAESVLPDARSLAIRLRIPEVFLMHVCTAHECEYMPPHRDYINRMCQVLDKQIADAPGVESGMGKTMVTPLLSVGQPPEEILKTIDQNNIDLVLMASHGRSGLRRWALGGVTDKVLRASPAPVWVRCGKRKSETIEASSQLVLVPLDGSQLAECVLPHVEALCSGRFENHLQVVLMSVSEPVVPPAFYPAISSEDWEAQMKRSQTFTWRYLAGLEARLHRKGIAVRSEVRVGDAASEILKYSSTNPTHLVVLCTHGRSGYTKWVYGSVAEKVLLGSRCPLLLVKPTKASGTQPRH